MAMFPNVNIAMRSNESPITKTCRPKRGGTPFLYSDNSLKYGDEGARPGGFTKPTSRSRDAARTSA